MKPTSNPWPPKKSDAYHVSNLDSNVAIITLWSKKELYIETIDKNSYSIISPLYSREEGVNLLIRGLFANKKITELIICGVDMNQCSNVISDFFEKGINKAHVVIGKQKSELDKEIPLDSINNLRKNVQLHNLVGKTPKKVKEYINTIKTKDPWGNYEIFKEKNIPQIKNNSKNYKFEQDPKGSFVIKIEKKEIFIKHLDIDGKPTFEFKVKSAKEGYEVIVAHELISDLSHAMDIGCELQKAEIAMRQGLTYVQDNELVFGK